MVSQKDKEYLLSLKPEDLTFRTLVDLLGNTVDTKTKIEDRKLARFKTNEKLELLPSEYFVKEKTQTTVGRLIYNKYIVERLNLQDVLGYVNFPLTDSANAKKIEATLAKALVDDKITIDTFVKYVDYRDNLGMQLNSVITTSFTPNTIMTPKPIQKKRDELFKKYDKELSEGDIVVAERIEKELVSETKKLLKGDVGLDLYNSEARGNFNNFKNMNIFKGATMNNITGKYEIVRSSFMDGIKKEEIPNFASSITSGAYPKAVGTQESGYLAKQLLAALQTEVLDEHGSDCGTKKTIDIKLTDKNKRDFEHRYIVENGKLVELTTEEMEKHVGKVVKLRTPMYCLGDKICNKCAGEMNYKFNNLNIGLGCSRPATTLLRMGMKKFHSFDVKSKQIDVTDMLI